MDEDIGQHLEARQYREAFELLLERYRDRVFRLACGFLRNETAAEDTAQDVFLRIWKALPGFHAQAALSTWVYTITRNTCFTALKKQRSTVSLSEPEISQALEQLPELQTEEPAAGVELDVQGLLEQLPDKYRRVIALFYLEQKSYDEVSAMLGIPLGTVKTFLHRARKELLRIAARRENTLAPC